MTAAKFPHLPDVAGLSDADAELVWHQCANVDRRTWSATLPPRIEQLVHPSAPFRDQAIIDAHRLVLEHQAHMLNSPEGPMVGEFLPSDEGWAAMEERANELHEAVFVLETYAELARAVKYQHPTTDELGLTVQSVQAVELRAHTLLVLPGVMDTLHSIVRCTHVRRRGRPHIAVTIERADSDLVGTSRENYETLVFAPESLCVHATTRTVLS